jgi:hypothetical protein
VFACVSYYGLNCTEHGAKLRCSGDRSDKVISEIRCGRTNSTGYYFQS